MKCPLVASSLSKPDMARVRSTSWVPPAWKEKNLPATEKLTISGEIKIQRFDQIIETNMKPMVLRSSLELHGNLCCALWRFVEVWSFMVNHLPHIWNLRYNDHTRFSSNCWMFDIYHSNSVKILLIHLYSLRIKLSVWPVSKDSRLKRLKYLGKGQNEDPNFCEISDLSWPIYSYKKPKQITAVVTERQQWRRRQERRRQRQLRRHHRQTIILIKPWSSSATASSSSSHLTNQQSQISRTSARWWPGWEALNGVAVIRWPTLLRRPAPTSVPNP